MVPNINTHNKQRRTVWSLGYNLGYVEIPRKVLEDKVLEKRGNGRTNRHLQSDIQMNTYLKYKIVTEDRDLEIYRASRQAMGLRYLLRTRRFKQRSVLNKDVFWKGCGNSQRLKMQRSGQCLCSSS